MRLAVVGRLQCDLEILRYAFPETHYKEAVDTLLTVRYARGI